MFIRTTALTPVELRAAIVREPLVVSPDTTVRDAIAQMSGVRTICPTTKTVDAQMDNLHLEARSSCVLVVENDQLLGIVTERDVVRLSAQQLTLDSLVMRQVMAHPIVTLRESAFTDLFFAINLLQHHHIRHLPIVDEYNRLIGLVTHESLRQTSRPIDLLRLRMVEEVMTNKVVCAAPDSSMLAIAQLMAETRVSSVMIVESASSPAEPRQIPVGIVTERDIVQFQALGLSLETYLAQAVMSTPIFAVKPDDSLWTVQQIMEQRSIRRLAVTNQQGALLGIVTQTSLLQALNPLEIYKLAQMLEEKVVRLETEKVQLLENLLEQEVETRTIALKAKAQREKLVADVASQIRSSLSLQTILDTTVEQVRQVLGCDRVNIWQFEANWQTIAVAESTDLPLSLLGERIKDSCFKQDQAEIYRQGKIRVVPDIFTTEMSDCHRQMLIRRPIRAKIIVPLLCGDELWGLLNVSESHHAREWLPEEIELLQALAVHLAIALGQATTHQQLQEELSTRQRIENQLRESEERYATLVEAAPVGIFRTDAAGNCIYVNDRWCQISGLNPKTAAREGWRQGLHPEDREAIALEWQQSAEENRPFQLEYRFQRPDGVVTWVYGQSVAELDAEGQVVGYVGTVTDISDRKQAEVALSQLAAIVESSADAIISKTLDGAIVSWNKGAEKLFGYQAQEVIGQSILLLIPNELKNEESSILEKIQQGEVIHHYETVRQNKDGKLIDISLTVSPIKDATGKIVGASKIARDISDRKQAEVALIQSEAHQRALITAIPDLMMRIDRRGIYLEFVTTSSNFPVVGNLSEMVGSHVFESLPPDAAQKRMDFIQRALDMNSIQIYEQELDIDGRNQIEEIRVVPYSKDEVLALVRDISDRKRAEAALIQSEAQSRAILAAIPDFMFRMGADGIYRGFVTTNRQIDFLPPDFDTVGLAMVDLVPVEIANRHLHYLKKALRTGELQVYEQQIKIGDRFQDEEVRVVKSSEDEALFMIRDISDRKQAERQLHQLNQQLEAKVKERTKQLSQVNSLQRAILDGADYSIISTDLTGIIETFNAGAEVMLGYSAAEIVGKTTPAIFHDLNEVIDRAASLSVELGQDISPGFEVFVAKARQGTISEEEWSYIRKDGSRFPVLLSVTSLKNANQQIIGFLGIAKDITERKRAEAELQKLSNRLTLALKSGAIGCWEWDITQNILLWDERMYELYGISKQSDFRLVYDIWVSGLHPDDRLSNETLIQQAVLGETEFDTEFRVVHPDGSIHFIKAYGVVVRDAQGNPQGMTGVNFDISDRKEAELERQQLIQELSAFKLALDQSALVAITDTKGKITYVNDRFCVVSGYSRQQLMGKTHRLVNSAYHSPEFFQNLWRTIASGQIWRGEICNRTKNGSLYWVASTIVPFLDEQGRPFQYLGIRFDITDRKLAEAQLAESEAKFRRLVEDGNDLIWSCQTDGNISYLSPQFKIIFGWDESEWIGKPFIDFVHPDDRPMVANDYRENVQLGKKSSNSEFRHRHRDGNYVWVRTSITPVINAEGELISIQGILSDISDLKETEIALQTSENRFRRVFTSNIVGMMFTDLDGHILDANDRFLEIIGYTREDLNNGINCGNLTPTEHAANSQKAKESLENCQTFAPWEKEYYRKDGSRVAVLIGIALLSETDNSCVGVVVDISDRKQTEKALQESQQFLQTVLDTIPLPLFWKNRESVFLGCNHQLANSLNLSSTVDIIGKTDFELSTTEAQALAYRASDLQVMASGEGKLGIEETLTLPSGEQRWIETHKAPLLDWADNVIGVVGMFQDITERKEVELRLQQQAKQERLLGAITQRMRSSLNLKEILNVTVEEIHQVLQSDRVLVYRVFPGGTGAAIAESVLPKWPKILDIVFSEEIFPEENYDRYIRGRVYALSDREDQNQSVLPCLIEFLASIHVRAKLVVPIILNQTLWGLLIAHQCDRPRQWEDWEINLFKQIANQLAIAIQQANLYEQVQSELAIRKQAEEAIALQLQRQRTLGTIVQQIRESLDLKQILATVAEQVKEILQGDRAIVFRLFSDGRSQIVEEAVFSEFIALKDRHWDNEVWSQEILECYWQGKPRIVPDVMKDIWTECLIEYSSEGQIQSKIVAPILQEVRDSENHRWVAPEKTNKLWGVLVVHACREKRVWKESEAQLLQQIANQLAIAIQQANLFEQLQQELTERQQAQQQITERNQQLAISNEELIRATRLKDEFLANMSHELRTPLNAILGMSEGLQEQVFGIVNEPQIKALQTIDRSGSHLLELINDILDVAKIESGQMELDFTTVSVNYLCQSSMTFIKQLALKKRIQLEMKVPLNLPDILIDERRIRQVLINLLNNAVKFTPEGGRITLEVSRQQREKVLTPSSLQGITKVSLFQTAFEPELGIKPQLEGVKMTHYLRIAVIDTGIGIAPENINKLFQPFIQIDSALNRQYAGTGLGLALVKRIVELHGGEVGLTSEVGVGSCFTIDLRYGAIAPSPPTELIPRQTSDWSSQSPLPIKSSQPIQQASSLILLAEDNEANITTFSSYLGAKGYRILLAKNGQEAIDFAKTHQPNLILMDIQMPGMDGLEAMRQIRRDPKLVNVPIVALTALAMTGDREKCLEAGANDYMTKPVKLKQLAATIQELLDSVNC